MVVYAFVCINNCEMVIKKKKVRSLSKTERILEKVPGQRRGLEEVSKDYFSTKRDSQ